MDKLKETTDFIKSQINNQNPKIAIVLGSGLGCFCDDLSGKVLKYTDIPNFGSSNVKGHKGELLFCEIEGKSCVIMQGRFHYYEGNSLQVATFPIKVFKKLGVETLILTNAAGSSSKNLAIGDIMLINDHINFMGNNPLIGKNDDTLGERFPSMSDCYTKKLQILAKNCAQKLNIDLKEGVYLATTGPSYETKAEVKAFRLLGADAIGMSTAPEAIVASYLKMNTLAFSLITNFATGVTDDIPNHEEVIQIGKTAGIKLSSLIKNIISSL